MLASVSSVLLPPRTLETNPPGDYEFGQTDCTSHSTRNYCCSYVEDSGFPGRFNGVDCTGAKKYLS